MSADLSQPPVQDQASGPTDQASGPMDQASVPKDLTGVVEDMSMPPGDMTKPPVDMAKPPGDMSMLPVDMAKPPVDMAKPPVDMAKPPVDMAKPPVDMAKPPADMSMPPVDMKSQSCGGKLCSPGQVCCASAAGGKPVLTCETSCGDGGFQVGCGGPEDCSGEYCCGHLSFAPGQIPNCPVTSASAVCQGTCNGSLPISLQCPSMATLRLCNVSADCAGDPGGYTNCCNIGNGMLSINACITNLIKAILNPSCT